MFGEALTACFFANWATCFNTIVYQRLADEHINDMEEIYALTPIFKQDYFITATNTGIFYTPESIFAMPMNDPKFAKFVRLSDFPTQKVNAVATETDNLGVFSHGQDKYYSLCERIVWVAGEKGIYKLYLSLDQDYFDTYKWGDFYFSKSASNSNFEAPIFDICGNEELKVTTSIPTIFSNQILIKWFKDDTEIPGSIGKLAMTFKETGIYTAKITSLCENVTVTSYPISVKYNMGPEITFTPPENVVICDNQPYVMETKNVNNYTYQWYKDDQKIVGATQFRYQTITDGKYRVEVSNNSCLSTQSSTSVALKFLNIPTPQIVKDKSTYCDGDVAKLSVSNQEHQIKWFKDGAELTAFANQNQMETTQSGIYRVELLSNDCAKSSLELPISFSPLPTAVITRSNTNILCYGETVDLATNILPNASYLWSNGETTPSITVKEAGKYFVVVTNANNCSVKSNEVDVIVNVDLKDEQPEIKSQKIDYCIGEEAQLSVNNIKLWSIKWFLDNKELTAFSNKNQITTTKPGKYRVVFLNGLNCEKTSPELTISFNNKLNVEITPTSTTSICFGESTTLSAGRFTNAIYEWSTGEKTESIVVKQSGTYSVKVISQFGCATLSQPVEVVVNPIPTLIANEQLKICTSLNEQVELKAEAGYVRYTWGSSTENTSNIKVNKPGLYTVQVEDANGCKAIKSFEVTAFCKEVLAPNAFSPNDDGINDVWTIAGLEADPNASIQIFNRMGTIIYTTRGSNPTWNGRIGTTNAPIGAYYYIIKSSVLQLTKNGILTLVR